MSFKNKNVKEIFAEIILSFLFVGYLRIINRFATITLSMILPFYYLEMSRVIIIILIASSISVFALITLMKASGRIDYHYITLQDAIAGWIIVISPYLNFNFIWIIFGAILYIFLERLNIVDQFVRKLKIKQKLIVLLIKSVIISIIGSLILHVLYAGYRVLQLLLVFLFGVG